MPPVHRRSRLLTPAELELMNERSNSADLVERALGAADPPEHDQPIPNDELLRKSVGGEAADDVRRRRFGARSR